MKRNATSPTCSTWTSTSRVGWAPDICPCPPSCPSPSSMAASSSWGSWATCPRVSSSSGTSTCRPQPTCTWPIWPSPIYSLTSLVRLTRKDRSLFKTWSEIRDWTKAVVAVATAAAIAAVDSQQTHYQKFLYQL